VMPGVPGHTNLDVGDKVTIVLPHGSKVKCGDFAFEGGGWQYSSGGQWWNMSGEVKFGCSSCAEARP